MNLDRTVNTLSFYRQGKKYGSNSPLKLASLYSLREIWQLSTTSTYSLFSQELARWLVSCFTNRHSPFCLTSKPATSRRLSWRTSAWIMMVGMILASDADSMLYVGCQDGSLRCINPKGKDSELENYIICKPHQDCVKKITCGKNIEGSILLFTVGNDSRMSVCSKTATGRRFDQQLHVKLRYVPNSLCFVDTLNENMVLSCSNSNYLLMISDIA